MPGDPVEHIIRYAHPIGDGGLLTVSVPTEFWTNLTQREEILGIGREEYQWGSLQVEFGEEPHAVLRRGAELW